MNRAPGALVLLALAWAAPLATAAAQGLPATSVPAGEVRLEGYPCQAAVRPGLARIGQPVLYRGRVLVPSGAAFRWQAPPGGGAIEWSAPQMRRIAGQGGSGVPDTLQVEIQLQAFVPGLLSVPGLGFEAREAAGSARVGHLPTVRLGVVPVLSPDDTSATLRPLRGPLGAPWWERVPWHIVGLCALGLVGLVFVLWRLRRRRAPAAAPAQARAPKDPAALALEALEALRGLRLPEHGRFAEHAFHLTRILRRFLEATQGAPRPGDTTAELLVHLGSAPLTREDLERLAALLGAWDRVKFARAASSPEEARRAEDAVEELVRRGSAAAGKEAA